MADFAIVGARLHSIACGATAVDEIDSFGRSAFNRYYYAAFLIVRQALGDMRPDWATPRHKDIPRLLDSTVVGVITRRVSAVRRAGAVPPNIVATWQHNAIDAARQLSRLFEEARAIREVADYHPEKKIESLNGAIALASCKVSRAHHWPTDARMFSKALLEVWGDLGL